MKKKKVYKKAQRLAKLPDGTYGVRKSLLGKKIRFLTIFSRTKKYFFGPKNVFLNQI